MSKKAEETLEMKARELVTGSKDLFRKFIPRYKIDSVEVTECVEKNGAFELMGPVGAVTPTGKEKTFRFTAKVGVDSEGECFLSGLQLTED